MRKACGRDRNNTWGEGEGRGQVHDPLGLALPWEKHLPAGRHTVALLHIMVFRAGRGPPGGLGAQVRMPTLQTEGEPPGHNGIHYRLRRPEKRSSLGKISTPSDLAEVISYMEGPRGPI